LFEEGTRCEELEGEGEEVEDEEDADFDTAWMGVRGVVSYDVAHAWKADDETRIYAVRHGGRCRCPPRRYNWTRNPNTRIREINETREEKLTNSRFPST
jgi:hypothetical protein